jgi:biotin carboxyl carrier protein
MHEYKFVIGGNTYNVKIMNVTEETAAIEVNGTTYDVNIEDLFKQKTPKLIRKEVVESSISRQPLTDKPGRDISMGNVKAPLPGIILGILVKEGEVVKMGQCLLKMEAMKMENDISSPMAGTVKEILTKQGDSVLEGDILVKIA